MMQNIPDAPWIRDAELNGMEDAPEPTCPICYGHPEYAYYDQAGNLLGCDLCVSRKNPEDDAQFYRQ